MLNIYKRMVIVLWFLPYAVGILFAMVLYPVIWAFTGRNSLDWWLDGPLEPFSMAKRWGLTND